MGSKIQFTKSRTQDKIFWDIGLELLAKGKLLRFRAHGKSMSPFIYHNEFVIVKSCNATEVKFGDIILYERLHSQYPEYIKCDEPKEDKVAHRFIEGKRINGKDMLITKGDAYNACDHPILPEQILGKVIAIEKPNGTIMLDCKTWRIANYMLARHSLLSLLIYRGICFLKRVLFGSRKNCLVHLSFKVLLLSLSFFPKFLIIFLFLMQRLKSKLKSNTASNSHPSSPS